MKIKILKLVTIACIAIIPPSSLSAQDCNQLDALRQAAKQTTAQIFGNYSLMMKGQRLPFDTAVAVNIGQYRAETLKFDMCDSLITALSHIVDNQQKQVLTLEGRVSNLLILNGMYELELERRALVNEKLLIEYHKLSKAYDKERTWIKRNGKWIAFGVGVAIGAGTYYILK